MVTEATWLWIGALGMLAGSISLFGMGGTRTQDEEGHTIAHGLVPLFAAISYFAMATRQGQVVLPGGREFLFARYLDWSITTPVLLLALSMTALHGARRRSGLVAGLLASDVVMIVTGMFFGASEAPFVKWVWYVISCVAFLAVYLILFGPMRTEAQSRDTERGQTYMRNVSILAVLWLLYPIIVIFGPDGLGIWSATLTTACVTILDLVAKVVYGFIAMVGSKKIADADIAKGEVEAAVITTHSVPSGTARNVRAMATGLGM